MSTNCIHRPDLDFNPSELNFKHMGENWETVDTGLINADAVGSGVSVSRRRTGSFGETY